MKRILMILFFLMGCGDDVSTDKATDNNGSVSGESNQNASATDSLNGLTSSEATDLCEESLDPLGYRDCATGPVQVAPPNTCGEWFSQLPACAKITDFRTCMAEGCTNPESAACLAIQGDCSNSNNPNPNNTTSGDGGKGAACFGDAGDGTPSNEFTSRSGNTNGCEGSLSCLFDTGTGKGTCEHTCSSNDAGNQGSCLSGNICQSSSKKALDGNSWHLCK